MDFTELAKPRRRRVTRDTQSDPSDLRRLLVHELEQLRMLAQIQCALLGVLVAVEILRTFLD